MGAFTRPQPSNPHLESGSTSLLLVLLEVINRFHFSERCALRPLSSIPEHIFKGGETLVQVKKKPSIPPHPKGQGLPWGGSVTLDPYIVPEHKDFTKKWKGEFWYGEIVEEMCYLLSVQFGKRNVP